MHINFVEKSKPILSHKFKKISTFMPNLAKKRKTINKLKNLKIVFVYSPSVLSEPIELNILNELAIVLSTLRPVSGFGIKF